MAFVRWEKIGSDLDTNAKSMARAKVPGGWLVAIGYWNELDQFSVTFLPDPTHAWDGNSLP